MKVYQEMLQKMLEKRGWTIKELARKVDIKSGRLQSIMDKEKEASMEELMKLSKVLEVDINELLHIKDVDMQHLEIKDELQERLNEIANSIDKTDQQDFIKAVEYLADCFIIKGNRRK